MEVVKGKGRGKNRQVIDVEEVPMSKMFLFPPRPDVCQICATDHPPEFPHNAQSLYYQTKFQMEHGRAATWKDAMAHCPDQVKAIWTEELQKLGVEVPA